MAALQGRFFLQDINSMKTIAPKGTRSKPNTSIQRQESRNALAAKTNEQTEHLDTSHPALIQTESKP